MHACIGMVVYIRSWWPTSGHGSHIRSYGPISGDHEGPHQEIKRACIRSRWPTLGSQKGLHQMKGPTSGGKGGPHLVRRARIRKSRGPRSGDQGPHSREFVLYIITECMCITYIQILYCVKVYVSLGHLKFPLYIITQCMCPGHIKIVLNIIERVSSTFAMYTISEYMCVNGHSFTFVNILGKVEKMVEQNRWQNRMILVPKQNSARLTTGKTFLLFLTGGRMTVVIVFAIQTAVGIKLECIPHIRHMEELSPNFHQWIQS